MPVPLQVQMFDALTSSMYSCYNRGMDIKDLAWIAGLLEGEGSFTLTKGSAVIALLMTDLDIVERSRQIVGAPSISTRAASAKRKPAYRWSLCGQKAARLMEQILPFMGERRSARIKELLEIQATKRPYRVLATNCPHTDRMAYGRGLCRQCHAKEWYEANKGKILASNSARYYANHKRYRAQQAAYRASRKEGRRDVTSSLANSTF